MAATEAKLIASLEGSRIQSLMARLEPYIEGLEQENEALETEIARLKAKVKQEARGGGVMTNTLEIPELTLDAIEQWVTRQMGHVGNPNSCQSCLVAKYIYSNIDSPKMVHVDGPGISVQSVTAEEWIMWKDLQQGEAIERLITEFDKLIDEGITSASVADALRVINRTRASLEEVA